MARGEATAVLRDPATRTVLDSIRRIVRALRESSRETERSIGLGAAQLFVLQRLAGAPPLSINELADRTLTHQSSVSVVVSRLVEGGLVARTRAATDGRRVEITLTAAGRAAAGARTHRGPGPADRRARPARRRPPARISPAISAVLVEAMALPLHHPPMFFERAPAPRKPNPKEK